MTREEAIRKLQKQKAEYLEEWVDYSGIAEAYDMAIEALNQTAWIPVGERLPEPESETQKRGTYLTTNEYGSVGVNNYEFESGSGGFSGWSSRTNNWLPSDIRIAAWKPLPEPYKGGDNND